MGKIMNGIAVAMFGLGLSAPVMADDAGPFEVPSPVNKIFIPSGFDDNDNVEIIMHGDFPNTCYQIGHSGAEVDHEKRQIVVWGTSYSYLGDRFCAEVVTPFLQIVKVGVLQKGEYTVSFRYDDNVKAQLNVAQRTTESPEDFLYAAVENAKISIDENGKQALTLQGHQPYMFIGCMVLRDVRMRRDPSDVLVVQPVSEIVNNEECDEQPADHSFEVTKGISEPFADEGLLHVRVLHGNSINRFVPKPE